MEKEQTISRSLEYHFTDEERLDMSKQLAAETQNKCRLEDQKKAVASQYGTQISEKAETINSLADKLASGYEFRNIDCTVEWHTPSKNKKTMTRQDSGESWTENMTEYDHNLFNQWQEDLQREADAANEFDTQTVNTDEDVPETDQQEVLEFSPPLENTGTESF
jgi:hypothetical protein